MQYKISRQDQRLQHACEKQRAGGRYSGLCGVFFTGKTCVASDGRIMAVKITESPAPPVDAIAMLDRPEMKGRHDEQIYESTSSGFFVSPTGDRAEIVPEGSGEGQRRFPAYWKDIIPSEKLANVQSICFNAEFLYRLAQALIPRGEDLVVRIEFSPDGSMAVVAAADYADRAGLIATVKGDLQFTACEIVRAVVEGRTLVAPTSVPVPVSPEPEPAPADFSDEDLARLATFELTGDELAALSALNLS
jgi:hypothetical protein